MRPIRMLAAAMAMAVAAGVIAGSSANADVPVYHPVSKTGTIFATAKAVPVVGDAIPAVGVMGTEVYWTRRSTALTYGTAATLEGQIVTVDGALPGAEVALYARPAGYTNWTRLTTARTRSDNGVFRYTSHKPSRNTDYRAVYGGDTIYAGTESKVRVNVRRNITSSLKQVSGSSFTMSGVVSPKTVGKTIRLQRKTCPSCSWSTIKSSTTSSTSTYRFGVTGPSRPGTWYFRAYTPSDSYFLTSYTDTWLIRAY